MSEGRSEGRVTEGGKVKIVQIMKTEIRLEKKE